MNQDMSYLVRRIEQHFKSFGNCVYIKFRFGATDVLSILIASANNIENSYELMKIVSDCLGTDKISQHNWSSGGCDTCGHGSTNYVELHVEGYNFDQLKAAEILEI
jgi:hypothetical protein